MKEKLELLNKIEQYVPQYGFEEIYERTFCSAIDSAQSEKKFKKNLKVVAEGQVGFSRSNVAGMRQFYMAYKDREDEIIQSGIGQFEQAFGIVQSGNWTIRNGIQKNTI